MSSQVPDVYRSPTKVCPLVARLARRKQPRIAAKGKLLGSRKMTAPSVTPPCQKDRLAGLVPTETRSRWKHIQNLHLLRNRTAFRLHPNLNRVRPLNHNPIASTARDCRVNYPRCRLHPDVFLRNFRGAPRSPPFLRRFTARCRTRGGRVNVRFRSLRFFTSQRGGRLIIFRGNRLRLH